MVQANKSIPHRRVIAVNGSGGAAVTIQADLASVAYVEISECPADKGTFNGTFAPQGLNFSTPDDNFVDVIGLPTTGLFSLGTKDGPSRSIANGPVTTPDGQSLPATFYMKALKSATVTATQVQVLEWPQR
jgi:hypothetical protein